VSRDDAEVTTEGSPAQELLACLHSATNTGPDQVTVENLSAGGYRVYGGQIMAQIVIALTERTTGKVVRSLHTIFPRAGRTEIPLTLDIESVHDGRSLASRRVVASQLEDGERRVNSTCTVLLHVPDEFDEHQRPMPNIGAPAAAVAADLFLVPGEARVVNGVSLDDQRIGPAVFDVWIRCPELPPDPAMAQALIAYVSDWPVIATNLRPVQGYGELDSPERMQTAVMDHALWFHQPFSAHEWLLVSVRGSIVSHGRGFGVGHVFTEAGVLVASFAQGSLIRPIA
jgi:acyl-CoA thioesterase-2